MGEEGATTRENSVFLKGGAQRQTVVRQELVDNDP